MDTVDKETRSRNMAAVKSKGNRSTELKMIRILKESEFKGWRRHLKIEGTPDFCWPKLKIALFVDGCFWHGCPHCYKAPKTNTEFWIKKIEKNRRRDHKVNRALRRKGWSVIRVWECRMDLNSTVSRIRKKLEERG